MRLYLNRGQTHAAKTKGVNNFAAGYNEGGEQLAASETRLVTPHLARVDRRSPTPTKAPGPSAKRTPPPEGFNIRSRPSQVPAPLRATHSSASREVQDLAHKCRNRSRLPDPHGRYTGAPPGYLPCGSGN